jgi:hypothetical protein
MNDPNKMFVWSGGNCFKLVQTGETLNEDMKEAARQRQQIQEDQKEWEHKRVEEQELKDALRKRFS